MSEYQYYEFAAIDRPLTTAHRQRLRAISSRAQITATSSVNTYNFGDLKADPLKLLERYFDLFIYVANWGTRWFAMRVPKRLVDVPAIKNFDLDDDALLVRPAGEHVIISITRNELEDDPWDDGSGHLASLAPLRSDLLAGDLQLFSLIWLMQLESDCVPDEAVEPPPGLTHMSGAMAALAEFLAIDSDLIAAASANAAPTAAGDPSQKEIEACIRALPEAEKTSLLLRLYSGEDPHLGTELRRRLRRGLPSATAPAASRTAGELRAAARALAHERARAAEERASRERLRRQQEEARARKERLAALAKRGEAAWADVENLIELRSRPAYEQAAALLADLAELAENAGEHISVDISGCRPDEVLRKVKDALTLRLSTGQKSLSKQPLVSMH